MKIIVLFETAMLKVSLIILCLHYCVYGYLTMTTEISMNAMALVQVNSNTNIIVAIVVPCIAVVAIILIIASLCYYFYRNDIDYEPLDSDEDEPPIPSPLLNTEETCYINAMIQSLASSSILIDEYNQLIGKCINVDEYSNLERFVNLLNDINHPNRSIDFVQANSTNLIELIRDVNWKRESQQDTFQLLSALVNAIQQNCDDTLKREAMIMPPKLKLLHTFTETPDFNKSQDHLALALALCGDFREKPGVELSYLMDEFFSSSDIEESTNKTQIFFYQKAPSILIIHIQNNEWDPINNEYIKPVYYVKYNETMKYKCRIQMRLDGSDMRIILVEYQLTAIVRHYGGIEGGHYIAYRKNGRHWFLTNDTQVEKCKFPHDEIPYIMVYEKMSETKISDKR